ncbi:MAG: cytochrome c maturation protein CcmE [Gammaproteobacteria bacterium]|nr:cytochrome c maturation protein CcmE [Pseudomonadota bacterium]MCH9049453.1 cytochrome c maturation protein CcmE [Pseudomonadota bacterium]TDJ19186.1 MAG: cytochrome c maturation protein CcmE [Gammaproteobacteria bacterium]
MTPRKKRIFMVFFITLGMGVAVALILTAFEKNLLYFYAPTQIVAGEAPIDRAFRIGGLVLEGSVVRDPETLEVQFVLTDTLNQVTITYEGILPDLFREGQGIVANGKLDENGIFQAKEVLAKHDENYMPPEVADALEKAGAIGQYGRYKQRL